VRDGLLRHWEHPLAESGLKRTACGEPSAGKTSDRARIVSPNVESSNAKAKAGAGLGRRPSESAGSRLRFCAGLLYYYAFARVGRATAVRPQGIQAADVRMGPGRPQVSFFSRSIIHEIHD
jgi:hypothetical protein